ncbi:MAG: acyl transferase [Bacteroidia bacterium]|nr:acyl transferase [Bacteroidia bacterium]
MNTAFRLSSIFETDFCFDEQALNLFRIQASNNPVYREYLKLIGRDASEVSAVDEIPFLPVEFFKTQQVLTRFDFGVRKNQVIFFSSGTSSALRSRHVVFNSDWYKTVSVKAFESFYGQVNKFCFLALLPSYLEHHDSSLVFMMNHFMSLSKKPGNQFCLNDYRQLLNYFKNKKLPDEKVILIGLTYALLDFADFVESHNIKQLFENNHFIVMETGGMKGRRKEIVREEVHFLLKQKLGIKEVHSEYGMTELLSQAYSANEGRFFCPPWMSIKIRKINDPFGKEEPGKTGGVNIIDLANIFSCAFISTQDLGRLNSDGSFEILGRFDNSDIRGCNLLIS